MNSRPITTFCRFPPDSCRAGVVLARRADVVAADQLACPLANLRSRSSGPAVTLPFPVRLEHHVDADLEARRDAGGAPVLRHVGDAGSHRSAGSPFRRSARRHGPRRWSAAACPSPSPPAPADRCPRRRRRRGSRPRARRGDTSWTARHAAIAVRRDASTVSTGSPRATSRSTRASSLHLAADHQRRERL